METVGSGMDDLRIMAYELRKNVLDMVYRGKAGHIGGDFSVMEILVTLYMKEMNVSPDNIQDPGRDYFIMSKGHSMEAYYAVLAKKGFLSMEEVTESFSAFGSPYIGHPNNKLPGIEMNSGSLGHGLSVCVGIAKACQMDCRPNRIYTVMGDGELAEGSVWEGVMAASQYGLDHLCAVIDRNRLQISGCTEEVMHHDDLRARFAAFGWNVLTADGNDVESLHRAFTEAGRTEGMPSVIIANTVKGCGVSFMENEAGWHHRIPNKEQYAMAMAELDGRIAAFRQEYRGSSE